MPAISKLSEEMFWNNQATPLVVINGEDLRLPKLINRIGGASVRAIDLSATSDRDEILRRQDLSDWLMRNKSVRTALKENMLRPDIPLESDSFLHEFNPEWEAGSCFMQRLRTLSEVMEKSLKQKAPPAVRRFAKQLRDSLSEAEALEQQFQTVAFDYISRAALLSGVVDFVSPASGCSGVLSQKATVSGYRLHCYEPLQYRRWEYDKRRQNWADNHPILSAPKRIAMALWNRRYDRVVYGQQVIDSLPKELEHVLQRVGNQILANDDMSNMATWHLKLAFNYADGELRVKVIDMRVRFTDERGDLNPGVHTSERSKALEHELLTKFRGYSWMHKRRLVRQHRRIFRKSAGVHLARVHAAFVHNNLPEGAGDFFSKEGALVENRAFEEKFGLYALKGLCLEEDDLPVKALYEKVLTYRLWVTSRIHQLYELSRVVETMSATAVSGGLPFEFPDVLKTHEHLIRFDSITPTHLIGQLSAKGVSLTASDLMPIKDLAKLNGKVVFLTGHNAGGKTVTQESLAETVYLAQCGLPVFGENVAFNPKEVMAVVFIERGAGSTAELLLRKIKATLEAVSKSDPARTLVVLDELGTGTQEVDGDQLARQVLAKLHNVGCSVLCSTQIMSLAQHAEQELGALMFQVDRDRHITPGIGRGDVVGLADKVGLTEFLH